MDYQANRGGPTENLTNGRAAGPEDGPGKFNHRPTKRDRREIDDLQEGWFE